MTELSGQSQGSYVGLGESQVDLWDQLLSDMYNELTDDQLLAILEYYRSHGYFIDTSGQITGLGFSTIINKVGDKTDSAAFLLEVLSNQPLYDRYGENFCDKMEDYKADMRRIEAAMDIETPGLFEGRQHEVNKILHNLCNNNTAGVSICGIGGQGKSSLAREVCGRLRNEKWGVMLVDLREQRSVRDVMKTILSKLKITCSFNASATQLVDSLLYELSVSTAFVKFLLCLDDCDLMYSDRQFSHCLDKLLCLLKGEQVQLFQSDHKVQLPSGYKFRLLLTTRYKSEFNKKQLLEEYDLEPLSETDAVALLKKSSELVDEDICLEQATRIVNVCARSPLAITVVSNMLKQRKFTPLRLLQHLEIVGRNVTRGLGVETCLKQSIDQLSSELQEALVGLSVFQSSPFLVSDAENVLKGLEIGDGQDVKQVIHKLVVCHLVLPEGENQSFTKMSLHPLVYQYIVEWKKPLHLEKALKKATVMFVSEYESIISLIVKSLSTSYQKAFQKLDEHKVHIMKYFDIMADHGETLPPHPKSTSEGGILVKKRVSNLSDMLLSNVKKRRLFKSEASRAKKVNNGAAYIFWVVEEADVMVMLQDKPTVALDMLHDLTKAKYNSLLDLQSKPMYPYFVHAIFHKVMGVSYWKLRQYSKAEFYMSAAEKYLVQLNSKRYAPFVAQLYSYMGRMYLDKGNLDEAERKMKEGLKITEEHVTVGRKQGQTIEPTWDMPIYYQYLGEIYTQHAEQATPDSPERSHYMEQALYYLNKGIGMDKHLKLNHLDGYYAKLKCRADVYILQGLLDKAAKDAEYVLDERREIIQPPHFLFTMSVYQVGRVYMLIGDKKEEQGQSGEAMGNWKFALSFFKEMEDCHLRDGSVPKTHPVLQKIKADHVKLEGLCGQRDVSAVYSFYKKLENGKFDHVARGRIKDMVGMLNTPLEIVKSMFRSEPDTGQFGAADARIDNFENVVNEQQIEMLNNGGPGRRDSGMGNSSNSDVGSMSSDGESLSQSQRALQLQKSLSLEDNVFPEVVGGMESQAGKSEGNKPMKKRQKTLEEVKEEPH